MPEDILDVAVIGAGFAGVCTGIKLLEAGITHFQILEKDPHVGGTWWENQYPGLTCDVPSHLYSFSFEPKCDWERVYPAQAEILSYIEHCVDKYGLGPYIQLNTEVVALEWEGARGVWRVTLAGGSQVVAHHVVHGGGPLNKIKLPDIEGLETFAGPVFHSARWDTELEWQGKRVAVIGTGASGVQLIPELAEQVDHLTVYQRTPSWVLPKWDWSYSKATQWAFAHVPGFRKLIRLLVFLYFDLLIYGAMRTDSWQNRLLQKLGIAYMHKQVEDRALWEKLTPDYVLGCKRVLAAQKFYPTFNRGNVELVVGQVDRITPTSLRGGDGKLRKADVLVLATGFDVVGRVSEVPVIGPDGKNEWESWPNGAEAYRGVSVAGLPNFHLTVGPNTGVGSNSVIFLIEQTVPYIVKLIQRAGRTHTITAKRDAQEAYNAKVQEALKKMVWTSGCTSWYTSPDRKVRILYPFSARCFRRMLKRVRWQDFEIGRKP